LQASQPVLSLLLIGLYLRPLLVKREGNLVISRGFLQSIPQAHTKQMTNDQRPMTNEK